MSSKKTLSIKICPTLNDKEDVLFGTLKSLISQSRSQYRYEIDRRTDDLLDCGLFNEYDIFTVTWPKPVINRILDYSDMGRILSLRFQPRDTDFCHGLCDKLLDSINFVNDIDPNLKFLVKLLSHDQWRYNQVAKVLDNGLAVFLAETMDNAWLQRYYVILTDIITILIENRFVFTNSDKIGEPMLVFIKEMHSQPTRWPNLESSKNRICMMTMWLWLLSEFF